MSLSDQEAINAALDVCSDLGFEMVPGFSTHWAMGAETLIRLGHGEMVEDWARRYRVIHRHYPRPEGVDPIDAGDEAGWKAARGDFGRVGDWQVLFERQLDEWPWREVLVQWWPRLMGGMAAGLTHGLIRTFHAVRSLTGAAEAPTPLQLKELATGLAYWAGKYKEQPGAAALFGDARLPALLAEIPRAEAGPGQGMREKGSFQLIPGLAGWPEAVSRLASPDDLQAALSDMTLAFAQVNLVHEDQFPVPLIHGVTAPAAVRMMLPYLPQDLHLPSYIAVWQANAALLSSFAPCREAETAEVAPQGAPSVTREELVAQAAEHGDEHAIKMTEACLREHALRPDPRYLLAAQRIIERIPRSVRGGPTH